jgi:hypothetical protein
VLVEAVAVGVCGTDVEIVEGKFLVGALANRTLVRTMRYAPGVTVPSAFTAS